MLPLFARHTFFSTTLFIVIYWVAACLAEYQTIDNLDESIHYYGAWTSKYENDDPQHLNWEGTVVYGDIPGADCVVYFEGEYCSRFMHLSAPSASTHFIAS